MTKFMKILLAVVFLLPLTSISTFALAGDVVTSQHLTTLYRAARKVISDNQALINDKSKGNKGLSGKVVVQKTKKNYKKATGKAFKATSKADKILLAAVADVMDQAQALINQENVGFKGFLPAVFARQVAVQFSKKMNGKMTLKLTAPKQYVRNRANRPDKWEHNVIENTFKADNHPKGQAFHETSEVKGKPAFRYILPEYYGQSCLGCHGTPKGEADITGGKKEGGVLGELGGAISLVIYK